MVALRTRRSTIATMLLLLLGFIAIPVQLWHEHGEQYCIAGETHNPSPSKETIKLPGGNGCIICEHQYTVYENDVQTVFYTMLSFRRAIGATYIGRIPITSSFAFSNKGPPQYT